MYHRSLSIALVILAMCAATSATVPQLINYQGVLSDSDGDPIVATTGVTFRIWLTPTGGSPLWTEVHSISPDSSGRFNVILGSITPLPDSAWDGPDAFLGITVASDPEMARQRLISMPYSMRVSSVDGAAGGNITSKVSIGPGHTNTGVNAFVAGQTNTASGDHSVVSGGIDNYATASYATVAGGQNNGANLDHDFVGGGANHSAQGPFATVSGGIENSATAYGSFIGGGETNYANGNYAVVGGGVANSASGEASTIGGGESNGASGRTSTVPGGSLNVASGDYSFASGRRAKAEHKGTFVWADHENVDFQSTDSGQFLIRASGGVGINTDSPEVALHVAGDLKVEGNIIAGSTTWIPFPFAAGYDDYEPAHPGADWQVAEYRKIGDVVELRGFIHRADHGTFSGLVGTLPVGFRPPARTLFVVYGNSSGYTGLIVVLTNGDVLTATSQPEFIGITSISFSTSP
ncbi:MAG TPA: hypothetical protein VHP63_02490 [candidate division Zixibacteria bacterium]|nr:hypothetical protein [candidate division Zixibacteria bacterium]